MALTINTNLSSLMVQLSLKRSTVDLNRALQQMTTGYRINSAKDDAAGYAVATKMAIDLSSYKVVKNNANLGLSLVNTAESSLDIVTTHLQRIRDLAEQAANGTYGQDSINAIQMEIDERLEEINRVISTTEYNGIKLFEGGNGAATTAVTRLASSANVTPLVTANSPTSRAVTGSFISPVTQLTEDEALAQGYTIIKTADDLDNIRYNLSGKYILMNDIDLSSISNWEPIGDVDLDTGVTNPFTGELNGNGYVIENLKINNTSNDVVGLFGYSEGIIKNLGLENVDVSGTNQYSQYSYTGGLAGAATNIDNCYVTGDIFGEYAAGGVVGAAGSLYASISGRITNSYFEGDVSVDAANGYSVGGLVAEIGGGADGSQGIIDNCFATGSVTGYGAGGLVGAVEFNVLISNSYSTGSVSGDRYEGGFLGGVDSNSTTTVTNSYFDTTTSGQTDWAGSIQGTANGSATGVTTSELNDLINNGTLPSAIPPSGTGGTGGGSGTGGTGGTTGGGGNITLQIGIDSSQNSTLSFDTSIEINLNIDVSTTDNARNALDDIDAVLNTIARKQTEFGAVQNRLDSIIDSIDISIENTTSSLSTIKDADIAKVSSDFIRAQILQQASATLLATANQSPSIALNLI